MAQDQNGDIGLHPDVFNAIQTPPISQPDENTNNDGLPSYAKLDVLIAYLTAPSTVNYDTLSDFLMTFKLYADNQKVWNLLASRLLWAASAAARNGSESETGKNVGTRTFVLLKMWIRDYFDRDFAPNLSLRQVVAESVTILSGCTEFVLLDHFNNILVQLRKEWDAHIAKFWPLPLEVIGNIDAPVPIGGPLPDDILLGAAEGSWPISHFLTGQIPIDADIAVPSIQSSPRRRKPKNKLSMIFTKRKDEDTRREAVLHDKVDLLAMQIICEYHQRERAASSPTPRHSLTAEDQAQALSSLDQQQLNQDISGFTGSSRTTDLSVSRNENRSPSVNEQLSTPTASLYEEDVWATPRKSLGNGWVAPIRAPSDILVTEESEDEADLDADHEPELVADPAAGPEHEAEVEHEREHEHESEGNVEAEDETEHEAEREVEREMEHEIDQEPAGPEPVSNGKVYDDCHIDDIEEDIMEGEHNGSEIGDEVDADRDDDDEYYSDDDLEGSPHLESLDGNEHKKSSRRFVYSDNSLAASTGNARIVHEQSMDTLNMNNIGLANTGADSEADMDFLGPSAPTAENWNNVDYDQFDQVSYSGSSLSTLSTSTRSAFSYHAPANYSHLSHRSHIKSNESISLLSEIENSLLQPCAGYTPSDAARLKAMPDYQLEGDALLATLRKLEGLSRHNSSTASTPGVVDILPTATSESNFALSMKDSTPLSPRAQTPNHNVIPRSDTTELYNQAFESPHSRSAGGRQGHQSTLSHEISQLAIASNTKAKSMRKQSDYEAIVANETGPQQPQTVTYENDITPRPENQQHIESLQGQLELPKPLPMLHIGLPGASHAPFVLSYTARAVAEQFTIIESEVAAQLDFTKLLNLDLSSPRPGKLNSWLEIVMQDPPLHSTALVLARFDLVYRWVQSEILLCPTPALQAQAISRFVHIAFESLRLQNFATMTQLVLGLCSQTVRSQLCDDVYNLLAPHDQETLGRLESLSSPAQNYSKLKKAHNRLSWAKGCVPYTPMFVKDIEITAEAASSNAEQEIHFGKFRVAAQVVKSLKKSVESSVNYRLGTEPALLSKCLYLASIPTL